MHTGFVFSEFLRKLSGRRIFIDEITLDVASVCGFELTFYPNLDYLSFVIELRGLCIMLFFRLYPHEINVLASDEFSFVIVLIIYVEQEQQKHLFNVL